MLKQNRGFQSEFDLLERDHVRIAQLNDNLFDQLTGIVNGGKVNRSSLLNKINAYLARYRKHIHFESEQIFPLATGHLSAADIRKLHRKTRFVNDLLFGGELEYKYHRLARNLSYEIEAGSGRIAAAELRGIESLIQTLSNVVTSSQRLTSAIRKHQIGAMQEQMRTCRESVKSGFSTKLLSLPFALGANYVRQTQEGWKDITAILRGHDDAASE